MVGAACHAAKGKALWRKKAESNNDWETIEPTADFQQYMKEYRFKEFRQFLPCLYEEPEMSETDVWWRFIGAVKEFNKNR